MAERRTETSAQNDRHPLGGGYGQDGLFYGCGTALRGRAYASAEDRAAGIQTRTRWIVFFGLPVVPLGTYRVRHLKDRVNARGRIVAPFLIMSRKPLAWGQVLRAWAVGGAAAVAVLWLWNWWVGPL